MPSIIATTTSRAIEAALITRIAAIVPTYESHRDTGWIPTQDNRDAGSAATPRLFHIEVTPGGIVPGGITGNGDTECELFVDIVAHYRAFNSEEIGTVIESDMWDLHDDMTNAINVVPGVTHLELAGEPQPADGTDESGMAYVYPFTLYYLRNRG